MAVLAVPAVMCLYRVDAVSYAANRAQNASRMTAFNELYGEESPKTANLPLRHRLPQAACGLDELACRSDLPPEVTACMTILVLKGHVAQQPGSVFARKRR